MKMSKKRRSRAAKKGWRKRKHGVRRNPGVRYVMAPNRGRRRSRRTRRNPFYTMAPNMMYATANRGRRRTRRNSRFRPFSRVYSNRRHSRNHMQANPRYVFANRGRRRRLRSNRHSARRVFRNMATDVMKDVVVPVLGGTAGFVGARVLANLVAQVPTVTGILDSSDPTNAPNTKLVTNLLAIAATIGVGTKVKIIKDNQGAIVTGMGLALVDKLLGKVTGTAGSYLSGMRGFGEYFSQPVAGMGEYFSQPVAGLGAYIDDPTAGMGEYFEQPVAGLGAGPMYAAAGMGALYATAGLGNQGAVDGLLDVAEAAAGVDQAAAGLGLQYATAGLGQVGIPPVSQIGMQSIQTPTDVAAPVSATEPYTATVPPTSWAQEGRGYAGGIFQGTVFTGERC